MKKLLVVLMVLAFVAPAMADDALDVSGSMRVEAYSIDNVKFSDDDSADQDFWDQRFRLQMKFKAADGVMAVLRTDITENVWGDEAGFNRPAANVTTTTTGTVNDDDTSGTVDDGESITATSTSTGNVNDVLMIDRAYLSVDKGILNITAGLSAFNLGMGHAYNNQGQGVQLTFKTPIAVRVGLTKESEEGAKHDEEDLGSEDIDNYWIDLGYKNDMLAANLFYATQTEGNDSDNSPTLIGAMVKTKIGPVNIVAELDMFSGENDADQDYVGTQFYAQLEMKLSDQLTVGTDLVYSSPNDEDDEAKLTAVNKFGDYVYQDRHALSPGSFQGDALGVDGDIFDLLPDGIVDDAEAAILAATGTAVDLSGYSTGSIGIGPYVQFIAMEGLTLKANLFYLSAADDIDLVESALIYGVGATWAFAPKTKLEVAYHAVDVEVADDLDDAGVDLETFTGLGAVLSVSF